MPKVTRSERALQASIAAHESWARTLDRAARTARARAALDARFLAQADGDPIRAEHLRKAHFARLALKSAQARRKSRESAEASRALLADAVRAENELAELGGARD